jgi:Ferritin-like
VILLQRSQADALEVGGDCLLDAVRKALQRAIRLEHSTIPPYLYALYSLVPGRNEKVADIIQSVVVEEMLHLTLAANILNALGGSPVLDTANFIPTYPGTLPGSVDGGLVVPLAPCSPYLISGVFMSIEQPRHELDYPGGEAELIERGDTVTIGEFYQAIKAKISELHSTAFSGDRARQIGPTHMRNAIPVINALTAAKAIDIIVDQGEGTDKLPLEVVGSGYAHFYRFAQIVKGGKLIGNPGVTPPYRYDSVGNPIPFDATGVYGVATNPRAATYLPGTVAQIANDTFNYTYTTLLKTLHETLNGHPDRLDTTLGLMKSLQQQAMDMMSGTSTGHQCIGPTFEYQLVNPGVLAPA